MSLPAIIQLHIARFFIYLYATMSNKCAIPSDGPVGCLRDAPSFPYYTCPEVFQCGAKHYNSSDMYILGPHSNITLIPVNDSIKVDKCLAKKGIKISHFYLPLRPCSYDANLGPSFSMSQANAPTTTTATYLYYIPSGSSAPTTSTALLYYSPRPTQSSHSAGPPTLPKNALLCVLFLAAAVIALC